jgi:hypothetical protein
MFDGQLELSFETGPGCSSMSRRSRRTSRAQWWFQRMRQVVDCALDRQPALSPRPEQLVLAGTHRQAPTASQPRPVRRQANREERQICE